MFRLKRRRASVFHPVFWKLNGNADDGNIRRLALKNDARRRAIGNCPPFLNSSVRTGRGQPKLGTSQGDQDRVIAHSYSRA